MCTEYKKGAGTYPDKRRAGFLLKKMKNSELKEYLNTFQDDAPISVILANPRKRKRYEITGTFCGTGKHNGTGGKWTRISYLCR